MAAPVAPPAAPWTVETLAACDVTNPLLGPRGCTRVFGPQKGVREEDFSAFEQALSSLASFFPTEIAVTPGAGAAGGLGFGLMAFCGARLVSGFGIVSELLKLEESVAAADLIVTGEGSLDEQTLNGKGPHGVAELARRRGEVTAQVTSARPLSDAQRNAVIDALKASIGSKVLVNTSVDPELIGGMIVKFGSRMVDTSVRTKLNKLQLAMKASGGAV